MARLLFTVVDRFDIEGRGVVAVPGLAAADAALRPGTLLEIRRSDAPARRTRLAGLELLNPSPKDRIVPIMFPLDITKADLPIGAEVWSVDS
ncbi:MAG: hypothetical protein U0836_20425 [Pirellulales bacterium]